MSFISKAMPTNNINQSYRVHVMLHHSTNNNLGDKV